MLGELNSEPHCIILVEFEAIPLNFPDDIVGVAVVQMHRSHLSYFSPAHHDPFPRMVGDVKDEVVFEIAEDMLSDLERLHIIVLLAELSHLAQIHLLNDGILSVRRPIIADCLNSSLIQLGNVFTAATPQIR